MRSWKSRFIVFLFFYCAGFGTALYFLAPTDDSLSSEKTRIINFDDLFGKSSSKSDSGSEQTEMACKLGNGLRKCVSMLHGKAEGIGEVIQAKFLDESAEDK